MALQVAELSIELIEALRPLVPRIERSDRSLADQLTRAATSVALNIAEAEHSDPGTRKSRFFSAAGSANESLAGLRVAAAWGTCLPRKRRLRQTCSGASSAFFGSLRASVSLSERWCERVC